MNAGELMTLEEACGVLGVSRPTVYNMMRRKRHPLPYVTVGSRGRRVSRTSLHRWLAEEERRCDL